jgi:hypothetical protein
VEDESVYAYVIVWIDYGCDPPVAVQADICSEEHPSSNMRVVPHCVLQIGHPLWSYDECLDKAELEVSEMASNFPQFAWIQKKLEEQPWYGGEE